MSMQTRNPPHAEPFPTEFALAEAVRRLQSAAATRQPCEPIRDLIGSDDVAMAYAVQTRLIAPRLKAGATRVGRKIGLTSPAVQKQLGVDRPDFGVLLDDMDVSDLDVVPIERLLQPRIEAEIAFVLKHELVDGPLEVSDVAQAVDYCVAALEIVDSRIENWDISFGDTVADNASSGLYVLSSEQVAMESFSPVAAQMEMTLDGNVVSTGSGADCLGDPLAALSWLARTARELGDPLQAGDVVLSGALGPMVGVSAGSCFEATISGLGTVVANFSDGRDQQ